MSFAKSISISLRHSRAILRTTPSTAVKNTRFLSNLINTNSTITTNMLRQQSLRGSLAPVCSQLSPVSTRWMSQTAGVEELSGFLRAEIAFEKDNIPDVPKLEHFVATIKGTEIVLTRQFLKETVTVKFDVNENENVNENVPSEEDMEEDDEGAGGEIVSYPNFTVTITKPSGKSIEIDCIYEQDEQGELDEELEEEQDEVKEQSAAPKFKMDSVAVLEAGQTRADGGVYESETTNMDFNLYNHLMNMLAERGVDNEFGEDLLRFSTAVEHEQHVAFLQDLRQCVEGK